MKKVINLICAFVALCWASSCTESASDFYQYIDNDCYAVVSCDALSILENAGFEVSNDGVKIPAYINSMLSSYDRDEMQQLLNVKGLDPRRIMLVATDEIDSNAYLILKLTDPDAFGRSLSDYDFEKKTKGDYVIYSKYRKAFVIDGNMALFIDNSDDDAKGIVNDIKKAAERNPLEAWQKDILDKGNTGICLLNFKKISGEIDLYDQIDLGEEYTNMLKKMAFVSLVADLKGLKLKLTYKTYERDGDLLDMPFTLGKLDKSMLKYADKTDFVAALFAAPQGDGWKNMVYDLLNREVGQGANMVKSIIDLMNGKFMASFGYTNIQQFQQYGDFHFSVAVQAENGKADQLFDTIRGLLNASGMPYSELGNSLTLSMGYNVPTIYISNDGKNIVVSTSQSADGCIFKDSDFKGCGSLALQIPARSSNITFISLPFGVNFVAYTDESGSEMTLKLTDTDGGLIENILKTAVSFR